MPCHAPSLHSWWVLCSRSEISVALNLQPKWFLAMSAWYVVRCRMQCACVAGPLVCLALNPMLPCCAAVLHVRCQVVGIGTALCADAERSEQDLFWDMAVQVAAAAYADQGHMLAPRLVV